MIPNKPFGRTGHLSTRVIFGSYALSQASQKEADCVLEQLLEYGINHIDTARMYGEAEKRVGAWMEKHRQDFFLATKTRQRSYAGAWKDLRRSLELLRVDQIDLWQMHGLTSPASWEKAMGSGGALEAFLEARQKGLVRYLGVTGHGNRAAGMHWQSLERFDFDSVLLPYNYSLIQNPAYAASFKILAEVCRRRNIAIQTIKSIARRPWHRRERTYHTYFYEPLDSQEAVDRAVHWVLGDPNVFLISAGDMSVLPRILEAANRFERRPTDAEMSVLVEKYELAPIFVD
jgi:aryl-alcohol dehydrogenase-like predicted oxidoreductase